MRGQRGRGQFPSTHSYYLSSTRWIRTRTPSYCTAVTTENLLESPMDDSSSASSTPSIRCAAICGTRARFVLMVLVLLCLASIWSNVLTFNFAIICIAPVGNDTASNVDHYSFNNGEKTLITSIVALAALASYFPVLYIVNRAGIRTVFTLLGLFSAVGTLLLPTAIRGGLLWVLVARLLQGIGFAGNFPIIGAFCSKWAYFKQTGLFVSVLVAYVQLSPAVTMSTSGALCTTLGWPSVFYAHGAACLLLFSLYAVLYRNSPHKHPLVGEVERGKIAIGKATAEKRQSIPYSAILRTPAVWAVWAGGVGNFMAVNLMFLYSPVYISGVLGLPTDKTGFSAALPPIIQFAIKLICGAISDRVKCVSELAKFRIFNSIAFCGCGICFGILAFMPGEEGTLNLILMNVGTGVLGATTGGFFKSGPVISKQYSHFVTGKISVVICLTMLVVPFLVNVLTPENTQEEWKWIWLITAGFMFVTNLIFCVFIRGEPCEWTRTPFEDEDSSISSTSEKRSPSLNDI